MMKKNIGRTEHLVRMAAGSAIVGYALWKRRWWGTLGSFPLITGLFRYCPVNEMLGMKVLRTPKRSKKKYSRPATPPQHIDYGAIRAARKRSGRKKD